jgi:hypothetical protein
MEGEDSLKKSESLGDSEALDEHCGADGDGFDAQEDYDDEEYAAAAIAADMGNYEEGDEDDSDSIDEESFDEFREDEEMANIPFINMINSNYTQLKKNEAFMMEQF